MDSWAVPTPREQCGSSVVSSTDEIFRSCFEWTKCNRCVVFDYGPMCSPEITPYSWDFDDNGIIRCLDDNILPPEDGPKKWYEGYGPGSVPGCKRALCECDKEQLYGSVTCFIN